MTHDDDRRALDARMAAAQPARDPDFDHPVVYAAARALIEELSMTTPVPDALIPPSRESGPAREDADVVLIPVTATPRATGRARRALAGAAAAAVALGVAVAMAGGAGSGDEPPAPSVSLRPVSAIRQDACRAATLWLDARQPGTGPDDEAQAIAEAEAALAAVQSEVRAAAETAEDELQAALAELEAAVVEQAAAERDVELAAMAAELEALQAAVEARDTTAVESQVADPEALDC